MVQTWEFLLEEETVLDTRAQGLTWNGTNKSETKRKVDFKKEDSWQYQIFLRVWHEDVRGKLYTSKYFYVYIFVFVFSYAGRN